MLTLCHAYINPRILTTLFGSYYQQTEALTGRLKNSSEVIQLLDGALNPGWLAPEATLSLMAIHSVEFELGNEHEESGQVRRRSKGNCKNLLFGLRKIPSKFETIANTESELKHFKDLFLK